MMRAFNTEIRAVSPITGELSMYDGPKVFAMTREDAKNFCNEFFPYCHVGSEDKKLESITKKIYA